MSTSTLQFDVSVETPSSVSRKLNVSVAPETIRTYMESSLVRVQKKAQIKGFRKGKVPLNLIRTYYLQDVKADVLERLVSESVWQALEKNSIRPVGQPRIEDLQGVTFEDDTPLKYTAKVDVWPEVKLKPLSKIKVSRPSTVVSENDIDVRLKGLQESAAILEPLTGDAASKPVANNEFVEISFVGILEDGQTNERLKGDHVDLKVGARRYMEAFEDGILGMTPGQTKKVSVEFGADFPDDFVAGKKVNFEITVHQKKAATLPELDDEFLKRYGAQSVENLREMLRKDSEQSAVTNSKGAVKDQLIRALIEQNTIDVPQSLLDMELESIAKNYAENLQKRGFSQEMIQKEMKRSAATMAQDAGVRVRAFILLDAVGREHKVELSDEDIQKEYERFGAEAGASVDVVSKYFESDQDGLSRLKSRLKEDKIVDFLLTQVKVEDEKPIV